MKIFGTEFRNFSEKGSFSLANVVTSPPQAWPSGIVEGPRIFVRLIVFDI